MRTSQEFPVKNETTSSGTDAALPLAILRKRVSVPAQFVPDSRHEFTDCIILLEVGPVFFFFKWKLSLCLPTVYISDTGGRLFSSGLVFKLLLPLNTFQHEHYLCIFFSSCVFSVKYWMYWQKAASFAMLLQYKRKYRLYIELKIAPSPNGYW